MIIHAYSDKPCTFDQLPIMRPMPHSEDWANMFEWWFHSKSGYVCKVPAGFICDLDSVPRVPVVHAMFKGRIFAAALGHDFEFSKAGLLDQKQADKLLYEIGLWEGVNRRHMLPIYRAVRSFGHKHYRQNFPRYVENYYDPKSLFA